MSNAMNEYHVKVSIREGFATVINHLFVFAKTPAEAIVEALKHKEVTARDQENIIGVSIA